MQGSLLDPNKFQTMTDDSLLTLAKAGDEAL